MKKVVLLVSSLILVSCGDTWETPTDMNLRTMNMDGMIAWYPFNGNAEDESPNFNHGTVYNAPLSHDRFENEDSAYYFGNSEFDWDHRIEADIDTEKVNGAMTIAWWIMREGTGYISPRPFEFWVPNEGNGKLVKVNGSKYIEFYGSSSDVANKKHYGGLSDYRSSEGRNVRVKYRGKIKDTILNILGGLRSSCTYVGAPSLKQLSKCTTFVRVTKQFNDTFVK